MRSQAILAMTIAILVVGSASAQDGSKKENEPVGGMIDRLYECGSLYAIEKKCYALGKSEDTERSSIAAFSKLDRTIHLIFGYGKRSGFSESDLLRKMHLFVNKNMADIGYDCKNISTLQSKLSLRCDRTLRDLKEDQFQKIND